MSGASLVLLLLESLHATVFDSPSLVCVWLEKKFNGVIPVAPHCNEAGCMGTHKSCMFYVQLANILASYIHKHSRSLALEVCPQSETNFTNDDNDGITHHEETKTILFVCLKSTIFLGVEELNPIYEHIKTNAYFPTEITNITRNPGECLNKMLNL